MSTENGVNPPAPNPAHNSNFSLLTVLGRERFTGPNYMDWMRNLRFTLRYENKEYVLDEQIPTINDDSTQEEIEAHQKHYDDANKVSCIMASSMSCELQKTFENTWDYEMNQQPGSPVKLLRTIPHLNMELLRGVFLEREMIYKEDSRSKIHLEEIKESVDEEPIMDVKTAFLNKKLIKDVFMAQPEGFENAKYPKECASFKRPFMDSNILLVAGISASMRKSHSLDFPKAKMSHVRVDISRIQVKGHGEQLGAGDMEKFKAKYMADFTMRDQIVVPTVQDPIEKFCNNESAVALTKEPKDHGKSKHIVEFK
ncbi:hypothetical protein Tco_1010435 [Tanacetum coccineum]